MTIYSLDVSRSQFTLLLKNPPMSSHLTHTVIHGLYFEKKIFMLPGPLLSLYFTSFLFFSLSYFIRICFWLRDFTFDGSSFGKESTCNAGDLGLIPGLGRSPEEGKGYPRQYSGLENSIDCIVHGVTKSQTLLGNFHYWKHFFPNDNLTHNFLLFIAWIKCPHTVKPYIDHLISNNQPPSSSSFFFYPLYPLFSYCYGN